MPALTTNTIKFVVGSLVGAVFMMLSDMNEIFVSIEKESQLSLTEPTFVPTKSRGPRDYLQTSEIASPVFVERNPYLEEMEQDFSMMKSFSQFSSVWRKKDSLHEIFDRQLRYDIDPGEYGAAIVSDNFAFLHIWANADGTAMKAIEGYLKEVQRRKDSSEINVRKWIVLVQDPLQHFLEGWALAEMKILEEVKERGHDDLASKVIASWETPDKTYDDRVSEFLDRVIKYSTSAATAAISPLMHALPQTNFMLDGVGKIHSNIVVVGDVSDWESMLEAVGYPGDISRVEVEPASTIKSKYFPSLPNRLSRVTLLRLCDFLALDYYLLSYDAPSSCLNKKGPLHFSHRRLIRIQHQDT